MKNKYLVIFIPSIEGGGVEKNLFIIANYLSSIDNNIKLITASKGFDKKFKNSFGVILDDVVAGLYVVLTLIIFMVMKLKFFS